MATYTPTVPYRTNFVEPLGWCLRGAQRVFNAPVAHNSATEAANATVRKHANRKFPSGAPVLAWYDHWGIYDNSGVRKNWGHVTVHFPGVGHFSSISVDGRVWFNTVRDVENAFAAKFRFWTDNINGLRVSKPKVALPTKKGKTVTSHDRRDVFAPKGQRVLKPGEGFYLHSKDSRRSAAQNIISGHGNYIIPAYIYAMGLPGDQLVMKLVVQYTKEKPVRNSSHYEQTLTLELDMNDPVKNQGIIQDTRVWPYTTDPKTTQAVYLYVMAKKNNKQPVNVTLLRSNAKLIK